LSTVLAALTPGCSGPGEDPESLESISAGLTTGSAFYDFGDTQCTVTLPNGNLATTMHCCPSGMAMVGLYNSGAGTFKCKAFPGVADGRFLDTATQRSFTIGSSSTTMHACPLGSVMVGLHAGLNRFACQWSERFIRWEYRDDGTQDTEGAGFMPPPPVMHTCSLGFAMSGAHLGQNKFGCAEDRSQFPPL
jgi:hypothetical protein